MSLSRCAREAMASESHEEKSLLDSRSLSEYGSGADVKNGSTLSYQNIVYAVRVRKKGPCRPADEKVILHNVRSDENPETYKL